MIFRPDEIKLLLQGKKTMCRRRMTGTGTWKEGNVYAVQASQREPEKARITILQLRVEPLDAITLPDAKREGHRTRTEFLTDWEAHHPGFDMGQPVWVISFAVGEHTDKPRLLSARLGRSDYTSVPALSARGEGEAVSSLALARFAREAHDRDEARKPPANSNTMRERERRIKREQAKLDRERAYPSADVVC